MKYLEIRNCKECPRRIYIRGTIGVEQHCKGRARKFSNKDNQIKFPKWCPLLDGQIVNISSTESSSTLNQFRRNIKNWTCDNDDKELEKVYEFDQQCLQKVLDAYIKNDYKLAGKLAQRLDTIVRDLIPIKVLDKIF